MVIVETPIFTRQVERLLTDDEYRELQTTLVQRPSIGQVIPGSGGLRKVRWRLRGKGKRSGARVIYYWAVAQDRLLMLFIYAKTKQDDLSHGQLQIMKQIVEDEYS
jgi:hypothetical protein